MRYQGRVIEWNDTRGFGFIAPSGGGAKLLFHASRLQKRGTRPSLGALVTYEVEQGKDGRPVAGTVHFVGGRPRTKGRGTRMFLPTVAILIALAVIVYVASFR